MEREDVRNRYQQQIEEFLEQWESQLIIWQGQASAEHQPLLDDLEARLKFIQGQFDVLKLSDERQWETYKTAVDDQVTEMSQAMYEATQVFSYVDDVRHLK
jgi:hypothetical protein